MRIQLFAFLFFSFVLIAGCKSSSSTPANAPQASSDSNVSSASPANQPSQPTAPAEATAVKPKIDACALLTSQEINAVQGEAVKETKLSGQAAGGLNVSQCFFTLPTFTKSVSLLVAHKGEGAGARDPKDFWRDTFHETKAREREEKEEEEESTPPKTIPGIGDEAFWLGSRVGGALYILKGNAYVRVSIGGPADQATKIAKSKSLAQKALARL